MSVHVRSSMATRSYVDWSGCICSYRLLKLEMTVTGICNSQNLFFTHTIGRIDVIKTQSNAVPFDYSMRQQTVTFRQCMTCAKSTGM